MARKCIVSGKGVMSGNNVSHANNKTRRRFLPNLQNVSFFSELLQRRVPLRVTVSAMRDIEHKGGFDQYILKTAKTKLDPKLRKLKREIEKAAAAVKKAA